MTPDEQRISDAYLEAVKTLVEVIGWPADDEDDTDFIPSTVNTDRIPATVLNAGHTAVRFLAVGHGIVGGDAADLEPVDADTFLEQLNAREGL